MNTHCSWDEKSLNTNIDQQVIKLQQQCKKSHYTKKSQHNLIPVYDISELDINNTEIQTEIYDKRLFVYLSQTVSATLGRVVVPSLNIQYFLLIVD